ncbi:regulatory protein, luxR family [Saccharopolyspora antimicrobica]|uniref:Regulatory protein, luxR family n=1 Tax=Saccharopolyspora antimicrobica TaxID=455193 RepID=A0A1I5GQ34_9PSEU|nr:regulatory protein, luxR family [Saccharopolyspora antimicrobica]
MKPGTQGCGVTATCLICKEGERIDLSRQIVCYLAVGYTDEQIARRLSLSVRTVRRRIAKIMEELDVVGRFAAGVEAARSGLICPRLLC